jgi:polyisoprenoid-binding protein YceI
MRVNAPCLLRALTLIACFLALAGCPVRAPPAGPAPASAPAPAAHRGVPYEVAAAESLLSIRVFKAGTLAAAGHNHVIASHGLEGTFYLPGDPLQASFEVRFAVDSLTVDEASLRAALHSGDFPPDVPDSAREGTRRNMLSAALLDGANYPQIVLRAVAIGAQTPPTAGGVLAHVAVSVRDGEHEITLPVRWQRARGTLTVDADTTLRQSALGLKPFSALLGALQVQDEMQVSLHLVAHERATP